MKVLAQTFALFLAITPLLAAPIHVPASDAVAETSGAHVGHYHHHHHTTHQPEERSLFGEEQLEERSFDEEEVMLERRGGALSTLKPKKEEKKKSGFEVVRKPAPQRQNSTGTARSVQVAQHGGTERTGPLRVVNQKRGNGMSSLKPKKKEEEKKKSGFEVVRKPAPQRQNSTGTARSVQVAQHGGTERTGPLRVVNQKRGNGMSSLKPKKKEEEKKKSGFEVVRKPAPQRQNSTGTARSVQVAQHGGTERTGPLRVVNQKRGNGMSSLKPKKKEEEKKKSGFEVVRKPAPQRQNSTGTARSVQVAQHAGTERTGPLRVTNP